jgi:hypothetical protein
MLEKINWAFNLKVLGGPAVSVAGEWSVEAYDKIVATIKAGETDVAVNIQPKDAGSTRLIIITAGTYGENLTYAVNDKGNEKVVLDAPHVLLGSGAVALLDPEPATLFLSNGTDDDVTVQIFVARMAIRKAPA